MEEEVPYHIYNKSESSDRVRFNSTQPLIKDDLKMEVPCHKYNKSGSSDDRVRVPSTQRLIKGRLCSTESQVSTQSQVSTVSQREREKEARKYKLGIALFLVLNVLLLALIAITSYYVSTEKNVTVVRDSDICVPCEDLRLHPDDTIEGIDRRGENKKTCCAKDKDGPDVLIGYVIDHWLKTKLATEKREFTRYECKDDHTYATKKPVIKLVGKLVKQTGERHKKLQWDGDSELAIYAKDDDRVKHHEEHGIIEIKKSGLYQVYSQIVLEHDMRDHDDQHSGSIYQHTVVVKEAGGRPGDNIREKILLKVSNTHCKSETDKQTITSYISGAFQLSEGDMLGVKAHNRSEVVQIPHMNFFGVHML